jgi:hypothetical protein
MRLHHSAKTKADPVRVPVPRTPVSAYARCEDCGADAGSPCVDEDLRPCKLCSGRTLETKFFDKGAYRRSKALKALKPAPDGKKTGA